MVTNKLKTTATCYPGWLQTNWKPQPPVTPDGNKHSHLALLGWHLSSSALFGWFLWRLLGLQLLLLALSPVETTSVSKLLSRESQGWYTLNTGSAFHSLTVYWFQLLCQSWVTRVIHIEHRKCVSQFYCLLVSIIVSVVSHKGNTHWTQEVRFTVLLSIGFNYCVSRESQG